ncbi:MAG: hypothetical protein WAL63_04155 [Solirubrobacteraceae bacterium]
MGDGVDDQRGQHRLGQVGEQGCEQQHRHEDEQPGDERRHLRAGARPVVDRGLRQAAAPGQAAEQPGPKVGDPERDHLLAGVDLIAILGRERLGGPQRLAEDDQQQPRGRCHQGRDVARPHARNRR